MAMLAPSPVPLSVPASNASSVYIPPGASASLAAQLSFSKQVPAPRRLDASCFTPSMMPAQSRTSSTYPVTSTSSRNVEGPVVFKSTDGACNKQALPGSKYNNQLGYQDGQVCSNCGSVFVADSKFCTRCGAQRPVLLPRTLGGHATSDSVLIGDAATPFEAQSVYLQPSKGVPEALYEGVEATEDAEARNVSNTMLERQLELEASMDGIEDCHKPRIIQAEVKGQHLSSQPDWNRREWSHDPFYGWRSQMESKIAPVPKEKMLSEARRRAAIEARENRSQLLASGRGRDICQDPFMIKEGSRPRPLDQPRKLNVLADDGAVLEVRDPNDPVELAHLLQPGQAGQSWHDAETKERILAASHMSGNWLAQPEAIKQRAILEYDIPVQAFTGHAPVQAGNLSLPPPSGPPLPSPPKTPRSDMFGTDSSAKSDNARSWTSLFSLSRASEPRKQAGSKASTASTDRNRFDPFEQQNSERPLNAGPSLKPAPGPLWFFGM